MPCLGWLGGVPRRALAQLAEHRSPKPKVGGSSPSCPARVTRCDSTARQPEVGNSVSERSPVRSGKGRERTSPVTFYRQIVAELRKVVWPTQQQLVTYLIVVLVFVTVMITYVSLLDLGFGKAVFALFG